MTLGYLLATTPQLFLDPRLSSHVKYPSRTYPLSWMIWPIATLLLVFTLVIAIRARPFRFIKTTLPFLFSGVASIPIFKPEMPHGNLMFVTGIWFVIGTVTIWIHDTPIVDPSTEQPQPSSAAQLEFIKEQTAIWKNCALGLIAVYLGMISSAMKELHTFNGTFVSKPEELFLLNMNSKFEIIVMSIFMFIGPIFRSRKEDPGYEQVASSRSMNDRVKLTSWAASS